MKQLLITNNKGDCFADRNDIVVDEKFLVEFLAQRGNTSTSHYLAVMHEINEVLKYFIEHGYGINLPFLNINYSLSGVFERITMLPAIKLTSWFI